ncbi:ATP-dependent DNA ligase [Fulvivirga sedimenti]|uniref:DNA ligase (ATP) n=1 Tax=Fulvivirga sedimenti TaxID=2879465 RepID=A0A9X1HP99_9BACT|nr:ATP-dependent DNA ligase [Fulvivirga sedimenti]MCA6073702.1 ATP-dependent DNA ligase [Fulvivirga sedimenti]
MKAFADLYTELDQTNSTLAKIAALRQFFDRVDGTDKLWTIALLSHRRPKRPVNSTRLKEWAAEVAGLPFWLVDETHHVVGDLAETVAGILPEPEQASAESLSYWVRRVIEMKSMEEDDRRAALLDAWRRLNRMERFTLHKILTGGFRVGVSQKLLVRALHAHTGIDESVLAHRLMGNWDPETTTFEELILTPDPGDDLSKPYPFYLAYALETPVAQLGLASDWSAEFKWDGIRGQIIIRGGEHFVWSRGEELVTEKYPEFDMLATMLPGGTVLDGEILPFKNGRALSFQKLQTRIGRKNLTAAILASTPVIFKCYDLLEFEGRDIRSLPFRERRALLEDLIIPGHEVVKISEQVEFSSWGELAEIRNSARSFQSEGLMLKHLDAPYRDGRKKGDWWKWKVDPLTIDAVMIYAMRGHGRRANLYTDYTFAVWNGSSLVPFTKAYSGLTDKEIAEVDAFIRKNTIDRFGPVRSVTPELVFEIAFEGIHKSARHKSGIALRFPRIKRWRRDKKAAEANTLSDLQDLLKLYAD